MRSCNCNKFKKPLLFLGLTLSMLVAACSASYSHAGTDFPKDVVESTILQPEKIIEKNLFGRRERSAEYQRYILGEYIKEQASLKAGTDAVEDSRSLRQKSRLTKQEFEIYKAISRLAIRVAQGKEESTVISLSIGELGIKNSYSADELGVDKIFDESGKNMTESAIKAINQKLDVKLEKIVGVVNADMPFELYWFDKTQGIAYQPPKLGAARTSKGDFIVFEKDAEVVFSMSVSREYGTGFRADCGITGEAYKASVNAGEIVKKHKNKSDLKKLEAYRDEIINSVDYNYDAVKKYLEDGIYGNPWQVIYVFDNNKDTNVVCEGYSKAFQYLCDLSQFDDKTLLCSSVSGDIMSDSGSGPHMWNTVKIGKKAYHVDLTNMDTESAPKHNELFLNGVNGSVEKGYRFSWNKSYIYYSYDNLTRHVFPQDILSLSAGSYYKDMKKPSENKKHAKIKVGSVKRLTVRKRQGKRLLQWEKAKNAGEYRVAYKTVGAKKWTYITTKSRKIAIKKLSKYKKYCFKVRAVKRVNKKISCGKWTAIKKN